VLAVVLAGCQRPDTGPPPQLQSWVGQPMWNAIKRYGLIQISAGPSPKGGETFEYKKRQGSGLCDVTIRAMRVSGQHVISEIASTCPPGAF